MRGKETGMFIDHRKAREGEGSAGLQNMLEGIHEAAIASSVVNWSGPLDKPSVKKDDLPEGSINTQALIKKLQVGKVGFQRFGIVDELVPVSVGNQLYWSPEQQELALKKLERIRIERKKARTNGEKLPVRIKPMSEIPDGAVLKHVILSEINLSQSQFSRLGLADGLRPVFTNGAKYYTIGEARIIRGRYNKYLIYKKLEKEGKAKARKFNRVSPPSEDYISREEAAEILDCSRETLARIRRNGQGLTTLEVDRKVWLLRKEIEGLRDKRATEKKSKVKLRAKSSRRKKLNSVRSSRKLNTVFVHDRRITPEISNVQNTGDHIDFNNSEKTDSDLHGSEELTEENVEKIVYEERRKFEIGTQFTVDHPDPKIGRKTFTIVSKDLVDGKKGMISAESPIAKALSDGDYYSGDKIKIDAPAGEYEVELVRITKDGVEIS